MSTATMTSKGQITVPRRVREDLRLEPGSKILFVKLPNGQYRIVPRTGRIEDLFGILSDPDRTPLTIEEMNEAIAEAGAESGLRGIS